VIVSLANLLCLPVLIFTKLVRQSRLVLTPNCQNSFRCVFNSRHLAVDLVSLTFTKPILDFMQTIPAVVYFIPINAFFGTGNPPGVLATIIICEASGYPPSCPGNAFYYEGHQSDDSNELIDGGDYLSPK
jgi:hypothetical protein